MKKISIGILTLCMCVLLTQCRKPAFPDFGNAGGVENFPYSLTVTTGDGNNSKGDFETVGDVPNVKQLLKYRWADNDELFVYSGKKVDGKFIGSKFLGKLDLIEGKNTFTGKFYGGVAKPESDDNMLRFIHFGTSVNKTTSGDNYTGALSVDFAAQEGTLGYISDRVIAFGEADINTKGSSDYSNVVLKPQFSVMILKFTDFQSSDITEKKDITVSGMPANQITVSTSGDVTFTATNVDPTMTLNDAIGTTSSPVDKYYTVFVPETTVTEHVFSSTISGTGLSGKKSCSGNFQFEANKYYVKECKIVDGNVVATPNECVGTWEGGMLPGKFSVEASKQVQFAKGNLVYDNGNFDFHANQYDRCFSSDCGVTSYYVETGRFDLFGWGTTGNQDTRANANQTNYLPYSTSNTKVGETHQACNINPYGYGPDYYATSLYGLTVSSKSDWGMHFNTGWRTMTGGGGSEWDYLLTGRTTDVNINGVGNARYSKINVNGVDGILIYPDDGFVWNTTTMGDVPDNVNTLGVGFPDNSYSKDQFHVMEYSGAVFLPAAGWRNNLHVYLSGGEIGTRGYYWSSSCSSESAAYRFAFHKDNVVSNGFDNRFLGFAVRLVKDVISDGNGSAEGFGSGNW